MEKRESEFQAGLIRELEKRFPGCLVMKNDANYIQGIPDLTVLYKDRWAMLECKKSEKDMKKSLGRNPNQGYYVNRFNDMSYASFVFPENKEEVLNELEQSFKTCRKTCYSKS